MAQKTLLNESEIRRFMKLASSEPLAENGFDKFSDSNAIEEEKHDDEEKVDEKTKQKYFNIVNRMSDSILRGIGIGGSVFYVFKNTIIKLVQKAEKPNPNYSKTLLNEALKISPPISS